MHAFLPCVALRRELQGKDGGVQRTGEADAGILQHPGLPRCVAPQGTNPVANCRGSFFAQVGD